MNLIKALFSATFWLLVVVCVLVTTVLTIAFNRLGANWEEWNIADLEEPRGHLSHAQAVAGTIDWSAKLGWGAFITCVVLSALAISFSLWWKANGGKHRV